MALPSTISSSSPQRHLQIPVVASAVNLHGRQSKVIISNLYLAGSSNSLDPARTQTSGQYPLAKTEETRPDLLYSTASLFFSGYTAGRHVVIFSGDSAQEHEFAMMFKGKGSSPLQDRLPRPVRITSGGEYGSPLHGYTITTVLPGSSGLVTIWESAEQVVLFADTTTTETLWAPILEDPARSASPFENFWSIGTNDSIVVGGPALVRSASYSSHAHQLDLKGDLALDRDTYLTVVALPRETRTITWNGQLIETFTAESALADHSSAVICLPLRLHTHLSSLNFGLPELTDWEFADSLPEIQPGFDDSDWTTAANETTHIPYKPKFGKKVLYGCDYGL